MIANPDEMISRTGLNQQTVVSHSGTKHDIRTQPISIAATVLEKTAQLRSANPKTDGIRVDDVGNNPHRADL